MDVELSTPRSARPFVDFLSRLRKAVEESGHGRVILKPAQVLSLEHIFLGKDTLVLLPTGYGKSIIFQILPWLLWKEKNERQFGIVLVVSPLNSLIVDQFRGLSAIGVPVGILSSKTVIGAEVPNTTSPEDDVSQLSFELDHMLISNLQTDGCATEKDEWKDLSFQTNASVQSGHCALVYTHPENVVSPSRSILSLLLGEAYQKHVVACVIDEAHCIVEWGTKLNAFRPDFGNLLALRSYFPNVPFAAFTATAPVSHIKQIKSSLQMNNAVLVSKSPDRPNIFYAKKTRIPSIHGHVSYDEILSSIAESLKATTISYPVTIIYLPLKWCGYAYKLFDKILGDDQYFPKEERHIPENRLFAQFHSPQEEQMKLNILSQIVTCLPKVRVIFATAALGMGVDSPCVQQIIHIGPPRTLEAYFQETGRAGRNKESASAVLYWNNTDIDRSKKEMDDSIRKYCKSEALCLREQLLKHFGFSLPTNRGAIHNCCDVCKPKCPCLQCEETQLMMAESVDVDAAQFEVPEKEKFRILDCHSRQLLREDLMEYRLLLGVSTKIRFGGIDSVTGLPEKMLEEIVKKSEFVRDVGYLLDNFDFWFEEQADEIFQIIKKYD